MTSFGRSVLGASYNSPLSFMATSASRSPAGGISPAASVGQKFSPSGGSRYFTTGASSKAILASLKSLQDTIRKIENEHAGLKEESKALLYEIERRAAENDHVRQITRLTIQEDESSDRLAYERLTAEKHDVEAQLNKSEEERRELLLKREENETRAQTADATKRLAEDRVACLEEQLKDMEVLMQKMEESDRTFEQREKTILEQKEEKMNEMMERMKALDKLLRQEKERRAGVEADISNEKASQRKTEKFLKGVLAVNETLVSGGSDGGRSNRRRPVRFNAHTPSGGGGDGDGGMMRMPKPSRSPTATANIKRATRLSLAKRRKSREREDSGGGRELENESAFTADGDHDDDGNGSSGGGGGGVRRRGYYDEDVEMRTEARGGGEGGDHNSNLRRKKNGGGGGGGGNRNHRIVGGMDVVTSVKEVVAKNKREPRGAVAALGEVYERIGFSVLKGETEGGGHVVLEELWSPTRGSRRRPLKKKGERVAETLAMRSASGRSSHGDGQPRQQYPDDDGEVDGDDGGRCDNDRQQRKQPPPLPKPPRQSTSASRAAMEEDSIALSPPSPAGPETDNGNGNSRIATTTTTTTSSSSSSFKKTFGAPPGHGRDAIGKDGDMKEAGRRLGSQDRVSSVSPSRAGHGGSGGGGGGGGGGGKQMGPASSSHFLSSSPRRTGGHSNNRSSVRQPCSLPHDLGSSVPVGVCCSPTARAAMKRVSKKGTNGRSNDGLDSGRGSGGRASTSGKGSGTGGSPSHHYHHQPRDHAADRSSVMRSSYNASLHSNSNNNNNSNNINNNNNNNNNNDEAFSPFTHHGYSFAHGSEPKASQRVFSSGRIGQMQYQLLSVMKQLQHEHEALEEQYLQLVREGGGRRERDEGRAGRRRMGRAGAIGDDDGDEEEGEELGVEEEDEAYYSPPRVEALAEAIAAMQAKQAQIDALRRSISDLTKLPVHEPVLSPTKEKRQQAALRVLADL